MLNKLFIRTRRTGRLAVFSFLLLAPCAVHAQAGETASENHELDSVKSWIANSSLVFIKNMGQYDHLAVKGEKIFYVASSKGADVRITNHGITYIMSHTPDMMDPKEKDIDPVKGPLTRYHRVNMELPGAKIDAQSIVESEKEITVYNFFTAVYPEGILNVPSYRKLTVRSIYEGIDWVIYCNGNQGMKFDFIVHPGADPSLIRYTYVGADKVTLDKEKEHILLQTSMGTLEEGQLLSYYEDSKMEVRSTFRLDGTTVSFDLEDYDTRKTVVVDPPLVWGTHNGDGANQGILDCVNDNQGNMYATGYTLGHVQPVDPGGGAYYLPANAGGADACILKFDSWGRKIWATNYGGTQNEIGRDITYFAGTNSIMIVGNTGGGGFPVTGGAYQVAFGGGWTNGSGIGGDGFYLRFNVSGVRNYATYFGGTADDQFWASATSTSNGRTFIVGSTWTPGVTPFPIIGPAVQPFYGGGTTDAVLVVFSPADVPIYGTFHGGNGDDLGLCIDNNDALIAGKRVYIGGSTTGGSFPLVNNTSIQGAYGGGATDGFIARYDMSATPARMWSSFHGGAGADRVRSVLAYTTHHIYFAEETSSSTYTICNPAYNYKGLLDAFVFRVVDATLPPFINFGAYFGSAANDSPWDMAHAGNGVIYLVGETFGNNFAPIVPTAPGCDYDQGATGGGQDGFIVQFDEWCTVLWSTYYGWNASDWIMGASVDLNGCLWFGGELHSVIGNPFNVPLETFNPGAGAYAQAGTAGNGTFGSHEQGLGKFCDCPVAYAGPDKSSCCGGVQIGVNPVPCYTYAWAPVTGLSNPNIANPVANPAVTTTYTLTVSAPGCPPTTDVMVFTRITPSCCRLAQPDSSAYSVYSVYPNPTRGEVNIQLLNPAGIAMIETYDAMGRLIETKQAAGTALITLSLEGRATGVYFVRIQVEGKVYIERIVKEN